MTRLLNIDAFKVGGIRFLKFGRLNIAISVSRRYRQPRRTPITIDLEPVRSTSTRVVVPTKMEHQPGGRTVLTLAPMPTLAAARPPVAATLGLMAAAVLATIPAAAFLVAAIFAAEPATPRAVNVFAAPPSPCELAALAPTDTNVEACLGRPFLD